MTWDRVPIVEQRLDAYLAGAESVADRLAPDATLPGTTLTAAAAAALYEDQLASRQIAQTSSSVRKFTYTVPAANGAEAWKNSRAQATQPLSSAGLSQRVWTFIT